MRDNPAAAYHGTPKPIPSITPNTHRGSGQSNVPSNRASNPARVPPVPSNTARPTPSVQSNWDYQNRE